MGMGDAAACEAAVVTLHGRRCRRGDVVAEGGRSRDGGVGGGWVAAGTETTMSGGSSAPSSLFSSTTSSLTDADEEEDGDGATSSSASSSRPDHDVSSSSLSSLASSGSETTTTAQMGGAAAGPLYALSTMMEDLPALRTGLSKYYQGRSQSFTSLADVSCVEDLAKKTIPCIRRKKAPRRGAEVLCATNRLSKTIAKKQAPRGKTPAYQQQGKREMYRC